MSTTSRFIYRQGQQRIQRAAVLDELALKVNRKYHTQDWVVLRAEKILRRIESLAARHGIQQVHEYTVDVMRAGEEVEPVGPFKEFRHPDLLTPLELYEKDMQQHAAREDH